MARPSVHRGERPHSERTCQEQCQQVSLVVVCVHYSNPAFHNQILKGSPDSYIERVSFENLHVVDLGLRGACVDLEYGVSRITQVTHHDLRPVRIR